MYAPNTPTTGTREGDYDAIADNLLQILLDTKPQRRNATPIFLIGMSRGAGGMLYALERLAGIDFAEKTYGTVTRAIAFAPRGTTVGRILSQETWQRVTTPTIIVSPSNDVITPQTEVAANFVHQQYPASTRGQNPIYYVHAGASHFGYTKGRGNYIEPRLRRRSRVRGSSLVKTMSSRSQRAQQVTIAYKFLTTGTLETCSEASAAVSNTCGGYCFPFRSWWPAAGCMAPCCVS